LKIRFHLPAQILGEDHADGFREDCLEEVDVRGEVAQVQKCPGDDPETAAEMILVLRAEGEGRVETENPGLLVKTKYATKTGDEVVYVFVGKIVNGKDVGKDAEDIAKEAKTGEGGDPVPRARSADIPFIVCRFAPCKYMPVIASVAE